MKTLPKSKFEKKRLETLCGQSNVALPGNLLVAFCIALFLWQKTYDHFLIFWFLSMVAVLLARYLIARSFKSAIKKKFDPKIWFLRYGACLFLNGLLWGILGIYAYFTTSQLYLSITLVTLAGLVAAGVATNAASIPTFLVFSSPILLPFGILLISSWQFEQVLLGILVIIYFLVTGQAAKQLNAVIMESLTYRDEKVRLLNDLLKEKKQSLALNKRLEQDIERRKKTEKEKEFLIEELQKALNEVKTLNGLIPICAQCKKVRDDKGYWNQIESYIQERSDADFSHSICPDCSKHLYPDLDL
ncbi:MAG: hypothetical protein C4518_16390 [Desulfobacteraceae bacterium]|nr:MAG: hypothetical protein C4518_16390 [Desulfobacteraceae bacterium]